MADIDLLEKLNKFMESALERFSEKNYNEAIRELKAAEVLDKENPAILYNIGVSYSRLGLHKTAIEYFERLINLRAAFVEILTVRKLLAYALIQTKDYKEAEKNINAVIKVSPSDAAAFNMKGYCLEKQGKLDHAVKVYQAVLKIDTHNYTAYNSLAFILAQSGGSLDEALKYAKTAFESNTNNPAYLDTLGYVYLKKGRLDVAEEYLNRALKLAPLAEEVKGHIAELGKLK
ncbi:MAG: tetratricopeptide repeat protein [bacterium]|nr:tetratricopeptide repeat protein [bacterium]